MYDFIALIIDQRIETDESIDPGESGKFSQAESNNNESVPPQFAVNTRRVTGTVKFSSPIRLGVMFKIVAEKRQSIIFTFRQRFDCFADSTSSQSFVMIFAQELVKDSAYWERRRKNNDAAKKSRDSRRQKEDDMACRAATLEQENLKLRAELEQLKNETGHLRALMLHAPVKAKIPNSFITRSIVL
ncbi:basic region leucine zipper [Ancylostoma ceylanicum]|uniref:Basic region leucine zipper n=1 Tax=Ancylostoma ceylanicum TaxID=53326 RepID=A0A0D6LNV1_9BILA|nr:basic region leucine zipper [Ancylostoma ceylanicum]